MAPLKILICGGGCAGPALAFWLAHAGHQVTVVERFPALRATGAQIDLRAQGIEVAKRMGLLDAIRSQLVDEEGVNIVDTNGGIWATIMANKSGKGAQSLTSEFEIMRGDLVRLLYNATQNDVQYIFGKTVENVEQDDQQVTAHFSDGSSGNYDLLVGADGQGSRIRKAIRPDSPSPYRRLGVHMAYWFIPREKGDTNIRHTCILPGGRMIMRRSHSPTESQVYFFLRDDDPELSSIPRASVEKQKEFWTRKFQGGGWQIDRFLEGMKTTTNWYCQEVVQVHIDSWHKGRIALLADAAHCASPFSGMGTTGSLVGAYVLAGEITQNADDLPRALENYERTLRPFVKEIQELNPAAIQLGLPESQWGVKIILFLAKICCWLRIPELLVRIMPEKKGGWELPEYPGLQRGQ
ncbi:FAD/NAD(P)-binding domain-containing protein [Penicillium hispanicum]|uniref:FAD/NAD(P)-binding domain-containing protein n=1 Tax=Penicillium hispanicum TaxID=1080232 RepID=UPI00253FF865|nr:FAD/NAD(P)-binding domain-containing protein [Penicillium hispanicum]KAJ5578033.1 FAD/NAD(P)-binding domain-containing protein [Penicillium hispanicum]